jgi:xanthine dehydrogenase accessory factor
MDWYERVAAAIRSREAIGVATVVAGPRALGAKMLVFANGSHEGELGLGDVDERIAADCQAALQNERAETRTYTLNDTEFRVFLEPHVPPPTLIIVGAGHTSIPLSSMAKIAGYYVVLVDARAAFASAERFHDVDEILVEWPHEALAERKIDASTYVAVLTHDSKFEDPLLPVLLATPARYIGVIGSRKTQTARRERLLLEGFHDADLARLRGPIGLDLGAITPEEIAISILAEMVACRHGRPGGALAAKLTARGG